MAEWSRVVNTTTHEFIKEEEVNILRNRKLLALMESRGRVTMNHAGDLLDWKVRFKRAPMTGYADGDILSFSRQDRWKTAQLGWRGYSVVDSMTKKERLMNKNVEAIVKVYSQLAALLMEDIEDAFGEEFYVDGNAAANTKKIHGIESFFGNSGASTKQPVGIPSDSYAGLNTDLADAGGSWTTTGTTTTATDWPSGTGDAHYDHWSPIVVDYTSAVATSGAAGTVGWSNATKTWPNTNKEAMRYGLQKEAQRARSLRGKTDLVLLDGELYRQFGNSLDASENVYVNKGTGKPGERSNLVSLGFNDVIFFEGCEVTSEYGLPLNVGYGLNVQNLELCSLQESLFVPDGPDIDIASKSHRFSIDFFGNLRSNPKFQFSLKAVT